MEFGERLTSLGAVSEAARQLGVDRRTIQRAIKREGVDKVALFGPKVAPPGTTALSATSEDKPLTEQEIGELKAFGWTEHDCTGDERCEFCREVIENARANLPKEQLIKEFEALGITREQLDHAETCRSCGCGICAQTEQCIRRIEATLEHTLQDCWCGGQHADVRGGSGGPRRDNRLAMSYASKLFRG